MTQAQQTHTGTSSFVPAAVAGLVMAASLAIALLVSGQITVPSLQDTDNGGISPALMEAGNAWQAEREQQAGLGAGAPTDNMIDFGIRFHNQPKTFDEKVTEARGW